MSMVMTSGFSDSASATASRPSLALPTTCRCSSALKIPSRTFRMNVESSTTRTRNFLLAVAIVRLRYRRDGAWRLRSYKLFVRRQFHAVAVLLKHSADEFAHADRVVRHHDYALLLDAVDGLGWNASARNGRRSRRKYSRSAGARLYWPALARFCCHHAVQIDQQNKAAIGRNRRTREEFYPAKVLAQVLDNDFVLAQNFFHDEANLPAPGICHHHPEITIDRFERRQPQIGL